MAGMIDAPEKLLAELIALPSVNPAFLPPADKRAGEQRVMEFLAATAARAGLPVEFQRVLPGRSNLIVRVLPRKRLKQRVILAPHLDTVGSVNMPEEHFQPRVEQGRLYGRGACDTKGSVAAMFTALLRVAEQAPGETEILFVGLVDEENAQAGSRAFARSKTKGSLAIVGEPTELKTVTAHKGDLWLKLVTRGKAAHGARPELGINAVHGMARAIELLETDYAATLRKRKHPVLGSPTINVGVVRGGTQPNIVPDYCEIEVDRRTIPGEKDSAVEREIVHFLRAGGLNIELVNSKNSECMPMSTDTKLPLVQQFMSLTGQTEPQGVDFFCDAAILAAGGIPSIVFGPGNIAQAHTANEWISVRSMQKGADILTRFLKSLP